MSRIRHRVHPTRTVWATQITAAAALAVGWIDAGGWNKSLSIVLVGPVSQAGVSYLVPTASGS